MDSNEITIKKMLLNATLAANLDTLKVYLPQIYDMFENYTPTDAGVVINDNGNVDLYNNKQFVYGDHADVFAKLQVEQFLETPLFFDLQAEKTPENSILYEHEKVLNEIDETRERDITSPPNVDEKRFDFICMIGVGLGYQVEQLFAHKQVQHLYLCEPSKDIFYAMLHCLELRPIFEHCFSNGGGVTINTGNSYDDMLNGVDDVLKRIGRFYLPRFYVFKHYDSEKTDRFISKLKVIGYRLAFGWGFMEDEIIGFRHTLSNLKLGYRVCKKQGSFSNNDPTRPVFIVANGPSLDLSLKFLVENQQDIIIVSCGTSLRSLLKNGIKPDIHVETERPVELLPYVEEIEKQQENSDVKLKDIQIATLNTVYPEVLKKFKSPILLNKLNDAGGEFIEGLDKLKVYARPPHSNPTCPNTAAALIVSLGFKEIYFIGTDFGYVDNEYHHSKDSVYFDDNYKDVSSEDIDALMNQELKRRGNFREEVFSNQIFDASRKQIEYLLSSHEDVNAYNCSDGALILQAKPTRIESLNLTECSQSKAQFLEELLELAVGNKEFSKAVLNKSLDKSMHVLKVTLDQLMLIIDKEVSSREELSELFSAQHRILRELILREEYRFNYWMIQGTFQYLQTYIMGNSYLYDDLEKRNEFMNYCLFLFRNHIDYLYKKLESQF